MSTPLGYGGAGRPMPDSPAAPAPDSDAGATGDLGLVLRYEPVVAYTQGELFLPSRVEDYVAACRLFAARGEGQEHELVAERGTLTLQTLAEVGRANAGRRLYLRYVDAPLTRRQFRVWQRSAERPHFRGSSRFVTVGLASRLIDSTMRLTLLLRGKVPGGYAAAAHQKLAESPGYGVHPYYARVSRDAGYIVLQYWFFYVMNDWRSTFGGVNDHEGDWEQVTVFLVDHGPQQAPEPRWVAFSAHDEVGDDLRRRWDDPDLTLVDGTHPVVYSGAGSHSGAYLPGEYVINVGAPLPAAVDAVRRGIARILAWRDADERSVIGIPYLDYHRGDGPVVGSGAQRRWTPLLVDDETSWVFGYRGLWGLDTRDPFGGDRAPGGPRYERDGAVRESWRQPVAWAALDKEAPTDPEARATLASLLERLDDDRAQLDTQIERAREDLRGARAADRATGHLPRQPSSRVRELATHVAQLRTEQARLAAGAERVRDAAASALPQDGPHAHLRRRALPLEHQGATGFRNRLLRVWTAASASLLLATCGVLLLIGYPSLAPALLTVVTVMLVVEAFLRGKLVQLVVNVALAAIVLVAAYAVVSIILGNIRQGLGLLLLFASAYLGWQTLREGSRTRPG